MATNSSPEILEIDLDVMRTPEAQPMNAQATVSGQAIPPALSPLPPSVVPRPRTPTDVPATPVLPPTPTENTVATEDTSRPVLRDVLETAVLTVAVFLLVRSVVQSYRISGTSMVPNFEHEQILVVNKLAYVLGDPQRGDVIVFNYADGEERDFIKRVIGVPGDTVEIKTGKIYINGLEATEPYAFVPSDYDAGPLLVERDKLYVLGDNRSNSEDSHLWGLLDQSHIVGKVWLSLWPVDSLGLIEHQALSIQLPIAP